MDRRLQAQIAHIRGEVWLRERAEAWAETTAEERLQVAFELGAQAMDWLALQPPEVVAALEASRPKLDAGGEAALRRWARGRLP